MWPHWARSPAKTVTERKFKSLIPFLTSFTTASPRPVKSAASWKIWSRRLQDSAPNTTRYCFPFTSNIFPFLHFLIEYFPPSILTCSRSTSLLFNRIFSLLLFNGIASFLPFDGIFPGGYLTDFFFFLLFVIWRKFSLLLFNGFSPISYLTDFFFVNHFYTAQRFMLTISCLVKQSLLLSILKLSFKVHSLLKQCLRNLHFMNQGPFIKPFQLKDLVFIKWKKLFRKWMDVKGWLILIWLFGVNVWTKKTN